MSDITLTRPEVELLRRYGFAVTSQSKKDIYEVNLGLQSYDPEDVRNILNQLSGNDTETKGPRGPSSTAPKTKALSPEPPKESKPERILRETREEDAKRIIELKVKLQHEPEDTRYPLLVELDILEKLRDLPDDEYLEERSSLMNELFPIQKLSQTYETLKKQASQLDLRSEEGKKKFFKEVLLAKEYDAFMHAAIKHRDDIAKIKQPEIEPESEAYKRWKNMITFNDQFNKDNIIVYGIVPATIRETLNNWYLLLHKIDEIDRNLAPTITPRQGKKMDKESTEIITNINKGLFAVLTSELTEITEAATLELTTIISSHVNPDNRLVANPLVKKRPAFFSSHLFLTILQELHNDERIPFLLPQQEYLWKLDVISDVIKEQLRHQ